MNKTHHTYVYFGSRHQRFTIYSADVTTNNDPHRIMTGGSLFYVEKWPPVIILRRKMTPSRRIMSPTRRINTRGVIIQRVGYRKMTPIEKWPPHILLWPQRSRAPLRDHLARRLSIVCLSFRTFIFGMCGPDDKTFPMVTYILSTWPWPRPLTYIWKTLNLRITFLPLDVGLSYWADVFLMTRSFRWYYKFWARDLDRDLWPTFEKL